MDSSSARPVVIGDVYGLVGRPSELAELLRETQDEARSSPGCLSYAFAEVVGEPGHYLVVQEWRDVGAMDAHYTSIAFQRYQYRVGEFLARPSEVRLHHVRQTLRLVDGAPQDPRRAD